MVKSNANQTPDRTGWLESSNPVAQPYAVWYPLLLAGCLDVMVFSILLPIILRGYRQAEARQLEAEELRRS